MSMVNDLFRRRIGLSEDATLTFEQLNTVLERTAFSIPFENLRIMNGTTEAITKDYLINKIAILNEGGLCYELNSILFLFLIENGFNAELAQGIVYRSDLGEYMTYGRTHVMILLTYEDQTYLVDTGFGGNLPLRPLPLSGETITSTNGQFRIKKVIHEHGDSVFEMKLNHKDTEWRIGYIFDSKQTFTDMHTCNAVQSIIVEHPESSFNKHPLVTRLTETGSITLTNSSITQWNDGITTKESIDHEAYEELLKQHFKISGQLS